MPNRAMTPAFSCECHFRGCGFNHRHRAAPQTATGAAMNADTLIEGAAAHARRGKPKGER